MSSNSCSVTKTKKTAIGTNLLKILQDASIRSNQLDKQSEVIHSQKHELRKDLRPKYLLERKYIKKNFLSTKAFVFFKMQVLFKVYNLSDEVAS